MSNSININAKVYALLFNKGVELGVDSDRLIATYIKIKQTNKQENLISYTASNNKFVGGLPLIKKATGLSLSSLQLYAPILADAGLLSLELNGDVRVKGNNKINKEYKSTKSIKLAVSNKLAELKLAIYFVRVKAAEKSQKKEIQKKEFKINTISKLQKNQYLTKPELRMMKKLEKKGITLSSLKQSLATETVLSNDGFGKLKKDKENNKNTGSYFKRRLEAAKLVTIKQRFNKIKKCSYTEYIQVKKSLDYQPNLRYVKGWLCEQLISSFSTSVESIPAPKTVIRVSKPLPYLSFDFIHWAGEQE